MEGLVFKKFKEFDPKVEFEKSKHSNEKTFIDVNISMNQAPKGLKSEFRDFINRKLVSVLIEMPVFEIQRISVFDDKNVTDFLNIYEKLSRKYVVSKKQQIKKLHRYCEFEIGQYIRNIIVDEDWKIVRTIFKQKFKKQNFAQHIIILTYLEILKDIFKTN